MEKLNDIVKLIESKRDLKSCTFNLSQEDIELIYSYAKELRHHCGGVVIVANDRNICVYDGGNMIKGVVDVEFLASIDEIPTLTITKHIPSASCRG